MNVLGRLKRFTVRRRLAAICAAYLAGIGLTGLFSAPMNVVIVLCALLAGLGVSRRVRKRSALLFVLALAVVIGHGRAAHMLSIRDAETGYGVQIEGTVARKLSGNRVVLCDVTVDGGTRLLRRAAATLMLEEGEAERSVLVGQRIAGTGRLFAPEEVRNPGGMDRRIFALCEGYELSGYILPGWSAAGEGRFSLSEAFRLLREALCSRTEAVFGDQAGLLQAILLGSRAQLDADMVQAMRLSGVVHVLTVSGMHLSMLGYALQALLRRMRVPRRARFAAETVLLGLFCVMTGGAPGTVRAFIMTLLREMAPLTGRRYDPVTALSAAALALTLVNPLWARSASFQFSFYVVLGMMLLGYPLSAWCKRCARGRRALLSLSVSLSAQLAALPMQLRLYGYVPLLALPMNVLCGALMPVLLLGGFGALLLSLISLRMGCMLGAAVCLPARVLERLSLAAAGCPWSILRLPAPGTATVLLYMLLMMAASRCIRVPGGRRRNVICLAALLLVSYLPRFDGAVRYVQLDVGQGDGALLRRGRHAVLIDVGPADSYDMLRYLRHEGLLVDAVILSHLDEDHAGALAVLLDSEIDVPRLVMAQGAQSGEVSGAVTQALSRAREAGVREELADRGSRIDAAGFSLRVLSPDETLAGSNERSLVLLCDAGGMTLLTLGDLPAACEMQEVPDCDILKVAHHGSRLATSASLIEAASPSVAIISVGRNRFGHPAPRVLADLTASGARTLRTDRCGCITVSPGKDGLRVRTQLR